VLEVVTADRFDRRMGSGKSKPILLACARQDGTDVELVAKLSAGCERGVCGLVSEAIAAMLAADLDLPVPEPFLVRLEPDFTALIPDVEIRALAERSISVAFGSKKLPPGFTTWPRGKSITVSLRDAATEVFAFDAIIANPDRRPENPNFLSDGKDLAIFDHELAFLMEGLIGWRHPWEPGALEYFKHGPDSHLLFQALQGRPGSLARFTGAWSYITDNRLRAYKAALPPEWAANGGIDDRALAYLGAVRDNIQPAVEEINRVLI
jgi:hypothetical protein